MAGIGFRIYKHIVRPPRDLIQQFRHIPVANIADNMGRISCIDSQIKSFNRVKLLGPAITVRVPAGDNLMIHKAMDIAQPGDVIVVDAESSREHALIGEIMFRYSIKRGIAGYVIDGCIRDVEAVYELDLPVYARGVNPRGPYKNGPGEINGAINCGGQVVHPGDIIVGDFDGVVVISPRDAEQILKKAHKQQTMETQKLQQIEREEMDRSWVDEVLNAKGCETI